MGNNLYPLVNDDGETFLTDGQLFRFVREKCGDAVADFLMERIETDEIPIGGTDVLKKLKGMLETLQTDLTELDNDADNILNLINSQKGVKA
jgi:hypothetical protein